MDHDRLSAFRHDRKFSQLVEKACRHWEARRQVAAHQNQAPLKSRAFTIAMAREVGTLGTLVAHEVGKLLGWRVYDHELLEQIAQEMGLRTTLLESIDERRQSWLQETVGAYVGSLISGDSAWASESSYVYHLVETVLALGLHGECVIVGRGSAFILPTETTLRVRLVGSLPERIAKMRETMGISESEAARKVHTIDRERSDFVRNHFGKDPDDPRNYDLVLNAPRLSTTQAAKLIVEGLHCLEASGKEARQPAALVKGGTVADTVPLPAAGTTR